MLFSTQSSVLYYFNEKMIETVLLDESSKQAQLFLDGVTREITASEKSQESAFLQAKIERAVEQFHEVNFSIFRLYIFDQDGNILADSLTGKAKTKTIKSYMLPIFSKGETFIGKEIEYKKVTPNNSNEIVEVAITDIIAPIYKNGSVVAAIEVEVNLENTLNNIKIIDDKYEIEITILTVVGGAIFMLFLWLFLRHNILKPIQLIDKTAQDITNGELDSRISFTGNDELFQLGKSINSMATSIQDLLKKQEEAYLQVLQSLAKALAAKDPYTAVHSSRVAKFSVQIGKHLNLSAEQLHTLKHGALMHDIGKIAIPDNILNKPDKLTDEEYKIMKSHPQKTADIMKPLIHYAQHREIAAWHHERWDGKGYPDGLKGEEIPLLARIVSIADTWDAMTGTRVYRDGMSEEQAIKIIIKEQDSGQWDPKLIREFIKTVLKEL